MIVLRFRCPFSTELTSTTEPRLEPPSTLLLQGSYSVIANASRNCTLLDPRHPILFLEFLRATSHVAVLCPARGVCQGRKGWQPVAVVGAHQEICQIAAR